MRKQITKEGNNQRVRITKEEMDLYNLKIGDVIEFTITKIINSKGEEDA